MEVLRVLESALSVGFLRAISTALHRTPIIITKLIKKKWMRVRITVRCSSYFQWFLPLHSKGPYGVRFGTPRINWEEFLHKNVYVHAPASNISLALHFISEYFNKSRTFNWCKWATLFTFGERAVYNIYGSKCRQLDFFVTDAHILFGMALLRILNWNVKQM